MALTEILLLMATASCELLRRSQSVHPFNPKGRNSPSWKRMKAQVKAEGDGPSPYSNVPVWEPPPAFQILQAEWTRKLLSHSQFLPSPHHTVTSTWGSIPLTHSLGQVEAWVWRMRLGILPRQQSISTHSFGQRAPGTKEYNSADRVMTQDSQHTIYWWPHHILQSTGLPNLPIARLLSKVHTCSEGISPSDAYVFKLKKLHWGSSWNWCSFLLRTSLAIEQRKAQPLWTHRYLPLEWSETFPIRAPSSSQ